MSQTQTKDAFSALRGHKYVSLTTYRKSGNAVPTPVWFAVAEDSSKLYAWTRAHSGKVKRIRNNPNVELAPCTIRGKVVGPTIEAVARILPAQEQPLAERAFRRKYGWQMRYSNLIDKLRGHKRVYLEIVPQKKKRQA